MWIGRRPGGKQDQSAVVVVPMMTVVEVPAVVMMMTPPACVGVEHLRTEGRSLDHRGLRRPVGRRERRHGKNGNGKQCRGNRFQHLVLLKGIGEAADWPAR